MSTPPNKFTHKILSLVLSIILLGSCTVPAQAYNQPAGDNIINLYRDFPTSLKQYAYRRCSENDISYSLFLAVVYNESRFTPNAVHINKNGTVDRGLCQINDVCHPFLIKQGIISSPDDLFNPYINIDCFIALMDYHLSYTTDEYHALLAYQVGEGAFKRKYSRGNETNSTHQFVWQQKENIESFLSTNTQALCQLLCPATYPYLLTDNPQLANPTVLFTYITKFPAGTSWKYVKGAYPPLI